MGRRPLGAVLHSSNEPGELSQWLCHDDSTINIVLDIIVFFIMIVIKTVYGYINRISMIIPFLVSYSSDLDFIRSLLLSLGNGLRELKYRNLRK